MSPRHLRPLGGLLALALLTAIPVPVSGLHRPGHPRADQGLNASEEQAFARVLPDLLANDDVDVVFTLRRSRRPRGGCPLAGSVYWGYAARGTICFTRERAGAGWTFDVEVVEGVNPLARRSSTALATLAQERAASSRVVEDPEARNLVDAGAITYPFAYERIVAEFDHPRTGDIVVMPENTADRGGKGAHGHLGVVQSRSTLVLAGRGARRSPLSARDEAALGIQHPDIAPTVARALGVNSYFEDTGEPGRLLNGTGSRTALLERQDGRPLDELLEPVFNTFVVVVDGLRPQDVNPTLMPNLTSLSNATCEPGGACATVYEQARAAMVTETNGNHVAMMTGAYGEGSGMLGNSAFDRRSGEEIALDQPQLNLAETLFDAIESQKPWLRTAGIFGKEKLRSLFDCTKDDEGACGPSDANPEGVTVEHTPPDVLGGATTNPSDPDLDCPAEFFSGSGFTLNQCVMGVTLRVLERDDPDLTLINLADTDGQSHLFGAGSPPALAAVADADRQIGRLVQALKDSGKWQHSLLMVTADHNFGDTVDPRGTIVLSSVFSGAGPSPFTVVTHGGSASVYLTDLSHTAGPLTEDEQATLKVLRARALATPGVTEALYRLPNPADGGDAHTLDAVHSAWNLGDTPRVGELLVTADETHTLVESQSSSEHVILGEHGHPTDRHVPFIVASGGTYVRDEAVAASGTVNEADDTAANPGQAEVVDMAPTVSWLLDIDPPAGSRGRVLTEAFAKHPLRAHRDGDISEPIANRAAIFIFDGNNSVELHCLLDAATCGDPVPPEAEDSEFAPTLRGLAGNGTFTRYGTVASWPSVTFPNHNVVGSGAHPGHHGMVNNRFYLREEKRVARPIEPLTTEHPLFHFSSKWLSRDVETLHEAVHRTHGDWEPSDGPLSDKAYTAAVNEPSARGADYATLEPQRSFPLPEVYGPTANPADLFRDTTQACAEDDPGGYFVESNLDQFGQTQARRLYDTRAGHPLPKYLINNFTLADGAGHEFGPHTPCTLASYRDSDRRMARILGAMEEAGVLGETLIVLTGDHGMENEDLDRRGLPSDFEAFLNERGVVHVMADWHVYLLTMDVGLSHTSFRERTETTVDFTVTDDDTGNPLGDALVEVQGVRDGPVSGTTASDGTVTLDFTPEGRHLTVRVSHPDFNERLLTFAVSQR